MRIGIFGGSFNPIHKYHELIGHHLVKNNYLDKVIFVPTGDKYHYKDISVPNDIRLKMINLVVDKYNYFEVDDFCFDLFAKLCRFTEKNAMQGIIMY